jgi:hypothetical protein
VSRRIRRGVGLVEVEVTLGQGEGGAVEPAERSDHVEELASEVNLLEGAVKELVLGPAVPRPLERLENPLLCDTAKMSEELRSRAVGDVGPSLGYERRCVLGRIEVENSHRSYRRLDGARDVTDSPSDAASQQFEDTARGFYHHPARPNAVRIDSSETSA